MWSFRELLKHTFTAIGAVVYLAIVIGIVATVLLLVGRLFLWAWGLP